MFVPAKYAMVFRRILLWPFTVLYSAVLHFRHALYNTGLLKSTRPTVPTIAIGNLALGGTGKTPLLELVLRTLSDTGTLATLSRGYGRTGSDFHEVAADDRAERSGDEPVQVKTKFPDVRVFVGADRVAAIQQINRVAPEVIAIVLDDALQHRRLNAGLNILLTTWQRPYHDDALLPAGKLRDLPSRAKSAQVVVVTKCPGRPAVVVQQQWRERLGLNEGQRLFFAGIAYDPLVGVGLPGGPMRRDLRTEVGAAGGTAVLLFTGIADPEPLLTHVRGSYQNVQHIDFPDHHPFSTADLHRLATVFGSFAAGPKTLITTEKDAARLRPVLAGSPLDGLPIHVISMRTVILNEPEHFADLIRRHVRPHPAHR